MPRAPKGTVKQPPQGALIVELEYGTDGYVFSLDPRTRVELRRHFSDVHVAPRVFIALDTRPLFDAVRGSMDRQALMLLLVGRPLAEIAGRFPGGIWIHDRERGVYRAVDLAERGAA